MKMIDPNDHYITIKRSFDYRRFDADADNQTTVAMSDVMQRTPYLFQLLVRRHLARMSHVKHPQPMSALLMVQPTSAGKSSVRDTHCLILGGFTLTIVPLLSLGTDQSRKMSRFSKKETGLIHAFNLDDYKTKAAQTRLVTFLSGFKMKTQQSILLFASPQTITNSKVYQELIDHIIRQRLLRLVCCDEIQLFVRFGSSGFRKEFDSLRVSLFNKLRIHQYRQSKQPVRQTIVPVLFMTATCTYEQVVELEELTGISLSHDKHSIFWPAAAEMYDPKVKIDVRYSETPTTIFKTLIGPILKTDRCQKFIWYSNNRFVNERDTANLSMWLDMNPDIKADVVPLTGSYLKEQKMWHILQFCKDNRNNSAVIDSCEETNRPFNPQLLTATSGAGNAGIDNDDIMGVGRGEVPPDPQDASQEKGRAGRQLGSKDGWYFLALSLESYLSLRRLYERSRKQEGLKPRIFDYLIKQLTKACLIFLLPQSCLHVRLAVDAANPFDPHPRLPFVMECGDRCSFCLGLYKKILPRLLRVGVVHVLMDIFLHQRNKNPVLFLDETKDTKEQSLVNAIRDYKDGDGSDSKLLILKSKSKGPMRSIDIKKMLFMLITADIIGTQPKWSVNEKKEDVLQLHAILVSDNNRNLNLYNDHCWSLMPTK
jgi:hypothetical protein